MHCILDARRLEIKSVYLSCVIPEIDIWRAANLMLKRYGQMAPRKTLRAAMNLRRKVIDDLNGAAVRRRITDAEGQLANETPPGSAALGREVERAAGRLLLKSGSVSYPSPPALFLKT